MPAIAGIGGGGGSIEASITVAPRLIAGGGGGGNELSASGGGSANVLGAFVSAASSGLLELNDRLRGRERPDAALAANGSCASGTDGGGLIVSGTGIAADRSDARV